MSAAYEVTGASGTALLERPAVLETLCGAIRVARQRVRRRPGLPQVIVQASRETPTTPAKRIEVARVSADALGRIWTDSMEWGGLV